MSDHDIDLMSPENSPGKLGEKIKSGGRRVNNVPIWIVGGLMCAFLVIMMLVAFDRANPKMEEAQLPMAKKNNVNFAQSIIGDNTVGMIPPAPPDIPGDEVKEEISEHAETHDDLKPPPGETMPKIVATNSDISHGGNTAPKNRPFSESGGNSIPMDSAAMPIIEVDTVKVKTDEIKLKIFEDMIKNRSTKVSFSPTARTQLKSALGTSNRDRDIARLEEIQRNIAQIDIPSGDSNALFQDKLNSVRNSKELAGISDARGETSKSVSPNEKGDKWELNSKMDIPTKYMIRTGGHIPVSLITGINSEVPGKILGQVRENVYDTATGRHLLIPQGTKVYGVYTSEVVYGQARLMSSMLRLVFPDGKALDLGEMPSADFSGYSGFTDQVNNHYMRIFGSAFLMSGITAGVAMSQPDQTASNQAPTAKSELSQALGQQMGNTASQMISKNLNIAPTLQIRPGYRFNVIVVKDIKFDKPYKSFDY